MNAREVDTVEFTLPTGPEERGKPMPVHVNVDVAGLSDTGRVRENNEDCFLIARAGRFLETLQTNLPSGEFPTEVNDAGYAMVVADGMGGQAAGEVASKMAIGFLLNLVVNTPDWIMRLEDAHFAAEVLHRAEERCVEINRLLKEEAAANPALEGFGTTLTLAWNVGTVLCLAHVGDSRVYRLRGGQLSRLTQDHTLAQQMADGGMIPQASVARHPLRHLLTNALSGQGTKVDPEVHQLTLEDGDCLLLCTDGLTDMLSDDKIAAALAKGQPADETCRCLVAQALEAGGEDNVTVIVARYRIGN